MFEKLKDPHVQELIKKYLRQLLPLIAGILISRGLVSDETMKAIIGQSELILTALGTLIAAGSAIWMAVNNTKPALVAAVDAMPEIQAVVTNPTPAGRAIAAAVPSATVNQQSQNPGVN